MSHDAVVLSQAIGVTIHNPPTLRRCRDANEMKFSSWRSGRAPDDLESYAMAKCVLLVDDSWLVRKTLRRIFESSGFEVCGEIGDGDEAVKQAPMLKPDLIVLDLSMPRLNGLQAAPLLRRSLPNVPIILFTIYPSVAVQQNARDAGVTSVISKDKAIACLVTEAQKLVGAHN
jgi:CheY-like chemotaxis protein